MTVQIQDEINFKNESYKLIGAPLEQFLKKNKNIVFNSSSTDNKSGYFARWELSDNELRLIDLESDNKGFKEIFGQEDPILADWFNGILEFGIGEFKSDHWWGTYENYVWLNFENGILKDRRIKKGLDFEQNGQYLKFGKYKYQTIRDIIKGKINDYTEPTLENYITSILNSLVKYEYSDMVILPLLKFNEDELSFLKSIKNDTIKFDIENFTINLICDNVSNSIKLCDLIERIFISNFLTINNIYKYRKNISDKVAQSSILINPDNEYLSSLIIKNDKFCCPPPFLQIHYHLKKLLSLGFRRKSEISFDYDPLFLDVIYKFSDNVKEINAQKYCEEYQVTYDKKYNSMFHDLSFALNQEKFLYYLNSHVKNKQYERNQYEDFVSLETYDEWIRNNFDEDDIDTVYGNLD